MSDKRTDARTTAKGTKQTPAAGSDEVSADDMVERTVAGDEIADAEAREEASTRGRALLQGAGAGLGTLASAVGRGAGATAAKAKTVVEGTSDKLETFAQQGPAGLKTETVPAATVAASTTTAHAPHPVRRTRKARLRVSRLDPWSVFKTILLFSVAFAIIQFVATWVLWSVFNASGAMDSINKMVSALTSSGSSDATSNFSVQDFVNTHKVLGASALLGALDVVLFTALATLGAFLYNLAATVLGGLELTLAED